MEKMEGYLLDIAVLPNTESINSVLEDLVCLIKDLVHKVDIAVKILGENKCLVVVPSDMVEEVTQAINYRGPYFTISSQPIIDYERFARGTLGVKDSMLPERNPPAKIDPSKPLFFIRTKVEYVGKSLEELFDIWRQEAVSVLTMLYEGQTPITLYKLISSRTIVLFVQVDAATCDNISFSLPIMKLLGDQVQIKNQGVRVIAMK